MTELRAEVEALAAVEEELTATIARRQAELDALNRPRPEPSGSGLLWPTSGTVTSGFGPRWGRLHAGIDIAAATGSPVLAADNGVVLVSGTMSGYGNVVLIDHGGGLVTLYGHLSSRSVAAGATVGQGSTIGRVGSTGHSTGPHLHFETRADGVPRNPLGYL